MLLVGDVEAKGGRDVILGPGRHPTRLAISRCFANLEVVSERPSVKSGTQFSGQPQPDLLQRQPLGRIQLSPVMGCLLQTRDECVR